MRNDRLSALTQTGLPLHEALRTEIRWGLDSLASPDAASGAALFATGSGRQGSSLDPPGF
jgi:enoyl-CoA hydratase